MWKLDLKEYESLFWAVLEKKFTLKDSNQNIKLDIGDKVTLILLLTDTKVAF